MTTGTMDVNAAFATERAGQMEAAAAASASWDQRVADGKLVDIGGGRFRVNDPGSWDNGEVFTQQNGVAMPQSQLDMVDGVAQLYSAVPAWHGLGNIVPGGTTDVEEVLRLGGLAWTTELTPAEYTWNGEKRFDARFRHTVRSDTGAGLGVVGTDYTPIHNRDAFTFLQELVHRYDIVWESAGPLRGGRKAFVSMRLPEDIVIDPEGIADVIRPFFAAINAHDGWSPFQGIATPWRPVCGNTERFALRDASAKWRIRHTKNAMSEENMKEARRVLGLTEAFYTSWAAEETKLATVQANADDVENLINSIWAKPDEDASKAAKTVHEGRAEAIRSRYALEASRVGGTLYAAERAVTGYFDNVKPRRGPKDQADLSRALANLEGADDEKKTSAHKRLMAVAVNR